MARPTELCPICQSTTTYQKVDGEGYAFTCIRCGSYKLSYDANSFLKDILPNRTKEAILSYQIRRMQKKEKFIFITKEDLEQILNTIALPTPTEKEKNLILWLGDNNGYERTLEENIITLQSEIGTEDIQGIRNLVTDLEKYLRKEYRRDNYVVALRLNTEGGKFYEKLKQGINPDINTENNEIDIAGDVKDSLVVSGRGNIIQQITNIYNQNNEKIAYQKKIIFQESTQLPSYDRIISWRFPFDVVNISAIGQPEEISETDLHHINVSATIELVSMWNLFHPLAPLSNQEEIKIIESDKQSLKKILFWYGKIYIEQKLKDGTLQLEEKLPLDPNSSEIKKYLIDVSRIPEPNGFKFKI